jgi:hypothetical protein
MAEAIKTYKIRAGGGQQPVVLTRRLTFWSQASSCDLLGKPSTGLLQPEQQWAAALSPAGAPEVLAGMFRLQRQAVIDADR